MKDRTEGNFTLFGLGSLGIISFFHVHLLQVFVNLVNTCWRFWQIFVFSSTSAPDFCMFLILFSLNFGSLCWNITTAQITTDKIFIFFLILTSCDLGSSSFLPKKWWRPPAPSSKAFKSLNFWRNLFRKDSWNSPQLEQTTFSFENAFEGTTG